MSFDVKTDGSSFFGNNATVAMNNSRTGGSHPTSTDDVLRSGVDGKKLTAPVPANAAEVDRPFSARAAALIHRKSKTRSSKVGNIRSTDRDEEMKPDLRLSLNAGKSKKKTSTVNATTTTTVFRSESGPMKRDSRIITIHVFDENRNAKKDFFCKKGILLREMKYFAPYLSEKNANEYIDIDVHCDIEVFEWLTTYMLAKSSTGKEQPPLEPRTVVSILISSDFLQMTQLVKECISYCHQHLNDIIKIPLDMNCINSALMHRLAKAFEPEELDSIKDRKDKIVSKIFIKKLEILIRRRPIRRCVKCAKLYSVHDNSLCAESKLDIDFLGNLESQHCRDPHFKISKHLMELSQKGNSWKEIYWRLWGVTNQLHCTTCDLKFPCTEYAQCIWHPMDPIYPPGEPKEFFPCCKQTEFRFQPFVTSKGCQFKCHTVEPSESTSEHIFKLLLDHKELITGTHTMSNDMPKKRSPRIDCWQSKLPQITELREQEATAATAKAKQNLNYSALNPKKRRRWQTDLQREADEHKMDSLTKKLSQLRSVLPENFQ